MTRGPDKCPKDMFKCVRSGMCIPNTWKCDRTSDCDDSSDEQNCRKFVDVMAGLHNQIFCDHSRNFAEVNSNF